METFKAIYPLEFQKQYMNHSVRPDGRLFHKTRRLHVSVGLLSNGVVGSSFVKLGNTTFLTGIRAELGPPPPSPTSRRIVVEAKFPPVCSSRFLKSQRVSPEALLLTHRLDLLVNNFSARLISSDDLRFDEESKLVWYLFPVLYCLDYAGNTMDTAVLSLLAALRDCRLHSGSVDEDGRIAISDKPSRPLHFLYNPISVSFLLLEKCLLSDPTAEEEALEGTQIHCVCDEHGRLLQLVKTGGEPVDPEVFDTCIIRAKLYVTKVLTVLDSALSKKHIERS